jgi:tetratricopeptide (TPR) repeat protein
MSRRPLAQTFLFTLALACLTGTAWADELSDDIATLAHGWAKANYQTPDVQKEAAFTQLEARAHQVSLHFAGRAEPLVWEGIIASSLAKYQGMFAAGKSATQARDLLLAAQKIDANVLDGSAYVSLGVLYYKVPGWPLSFGDKKKAAELLQHGLQIDPHGIDANYFYGEFLAQHGDPKQAVVYLNRALAAPPRPGREDADAGRRAEIQALLKSLNS